MSEHSILPDRADDPSPAEWGAIGRRPVIAAIYRGASRAAWDQFILCIERGHSANALAAILNRHGFSVSATTIKNFRKEWTNLAR